MQSPTSEALARCHATMEPVTTPESPRNSWPARKIRLDDESWRTARMKLASDDESWQGVMETLAFGWIAGLVDLPALREQLSAEGKLPPK